MTGKQHNIVTVQVEQDLLTIDMAASCAGIHPDLIEQFLDFGLIEPAAENESSLLFDLAVVPRLRMIERLRHDLGINLAGVAVIIDLVDKLCRLQRENEWLRNKI